MTPLAYCRRFLYTRTMTKYNEWCSEIVDELVRQVESEPGEWHLPWQRLGTPDVLCPRNVTTSKGYKGGNVWRLAFAAMKAGYPTGTWATYKQWASIGAQVRKGEKATPCVRWVVAKSKAEQAEAEEADEKSSRIIPRFFSLFNAAQVDGYVPEIAAPLSESERLHDVDLFLSAVGATVVTGGDRAYYSVSADAITMPEFGQFRSALDFYSTSAHEHGHWTGAASRLNRDLTGRFGESAYAFEELVAEMTAALAMARFGLASTPRPDHAQYVGQWVKVLTDKPKALMTAAKLASEALAFLCDAAGVAETDDELEAVAV
jgi:antirestriction protein ArdC